MQDIIKVVFLNEFDTSIFDDTFYSHLLKNVVNLMKKEEQKMDIENKISDSTEQEKDMSFSSEV